MQLELVSDSNFNVTADKTGSYEITGKSTVVRSSKAEFVFSGIEKYDPEFKDKYETQEEIASIKGKIQGDISEKGGIQIRREFFVSNCGKFCGLRYAIANKRPERIFLDTVSACDVSGPDNINISSTHFKDWRVLRYSRQKNEVPGTYRPSILDGDYKDVIFNSTGLLAGKGITKFELDLEQTAVDSEPVMMINNDKDNNRDGLFICLLGQKSHFSRITLQSNKNRTEFQWLNIAFEFDDMGIDPGKEVTTHWVLFYCGRKEADMLEVYSDIIRDMYSVPTPEKPLSYFCSWYFYGAEFTEKDLVENVNIIKEKSIPVDAMVIDYGWMDNIGYYNANEKFPSGMEYAAKVMQDAGLIPGIWTAPGIAVDKDGYGIPKDNPDMFARHKNGEHILFGASYGKCYVLDPTVKKTQEYVVNLFKRLRDWGFRFFKLDILRCISSDPDIRFADRTVNRGQAYRMLLELIRKGAGDDAYIAGCGGIYDSVNLGLVDSYRTSRDTWGHWYSELFGAQISAVSFMKPNLLRNYTNKFWNTDPDAVMLRQRNKPYFENEDKKGHTYLSVGKYNDEEARSVITNHFLGGGNTCFAERLVDLQQNRLDLLRHIIPNAAGYARILDFETPRCPEMFLTKVIPECGALDVWYILTVANWTDQGVTKGINLDKIELPEEYTNFYIFEFFTQQYQGVKKRSENLNIEVPPHGVRVLRLLKCQGREPVILGTDLHITGGACELADVEVSRNSIKGEIKTKWQYPVTVHALFPEKDKERVVSKTVPVTNRKFEMCL